MTFSQQISLYPALSLPIPTYNYKLVKFTSYLLVFTVLIVGNSGVSAAQTNTSSMKALLNSDLLKAASNDKALSKREKLIGRRCHTIKKHLGFSTTPTGQAMKYSCTAPVVGVAFYAGKDLGSHDPDEVADYIKNEFAKQGMAAKVFIKYDHKSGSSLTYLVSGGREVMHKASVFDGIKSIKAFVSEVKLVFLKDKKITTKQLGIWVKSTTPYIPKIADL